MRDPGQQLRRFAASWRGDTVLAAAQVASVVGYLLLAGTAVDRRWLALVYVLPNAAALPARRRWPLAAVAMACAALLVVRPFGLGPAVNDLPGLLFDWTPFLFAYSLGNGAGLAAGLVGSAALVGSLQIVNGVFNPIFEVMVLAGWLAGRIVASRRKLSEQLQTRNDELQAERELFAAEAVRYERARIAREVHDIVAHCLSLMVVQASAGQRSTGDGVTEALVSVADAAAQAQSEIGRLAELLAGEPAPGSSPCRWSTNWFTGRRSPAWPSPAGSRARATSCHPRHPRPPTGWSRKH
jgi:signal transduction histidine kinase